MSLFVTVAHANDVALTFDDLPTMALTGAAPYAEATTRALLDGLKRHHFPAIGFVVAEKLEGDGGAAQTTLVNLWLANGMQIGNHTYTHASLNKMPVDSYIAEVSRADQVLRPLVEVHHGHLSWFRHPFLETGLTSEDRRTFEDWLATHGYRIAPVTMENSDWLFALPYDDAILRQDPTAAASIRQRYLDYTANVITWYRMAAVQILGRQPSFVFLLHATRLNADSIDQLADILRRYHLHAVTLERALKDPAYQIPDTYAGSAGNQWLSRWSLTLHKELPWSSFPQPPADIVAEDSRLNPSP